MSWFAFRTVCSVAKRRADAAKLTAKLQKQGRHDLRPSPSPAGRSPPRSGARAGATISSRTAITRTACLWPDLCPQRLGDRPANRSRQDRGHGQRFRGLPRHHRNREAPCTSVGTRSSRRCRRPGRVRAGIAPGALRQVGHDHLVPTATRACFPSPTEITMKCSCPDWAGMCKHLAAVLYGVGSRLDHQPELLFVLRQVDHLELLDQVASAGSLGSTGTGGQKTLKDNELADVFGIDLEPPAGPRFRGKFAGPRRQGKQTGRPRNEFTAKTSLRRREGPRLESNRNAVSKDVANGGKNATHAASARTGRKSKAPPARGPRLPSQGSQSFGNAKALAPQETSRVNTEYRRTGFLAMENNASRADQQVDRSRPGELAVRRQPRGGETAAGPSRPRHPRSTSRVRSAPLSAKPADFSFPSVIAPSDRARIGRTSEPPINRLDHLELARLNQDRDFAQDEVGRHGHRGNDRQRVFVRNE